jgi:hypothetical protein
MTKVLLLITALTLGGNLSAQHLHLPTARLVIKVIDEDRRPVENANVTLAFGNASVKGTTDAAGLFAGEDPCGVAGIGSRIQKDGYYLSSAPIPKFTELDTNLNRWRPWNETFVTILRPITKPVALYAKRVQTDIPVLGRPCGYDLEAGDWVTPYGKGKRNDLVFSIRKSVNDMRNFDAQGEMTFANPRDGMLAASMAETGKTSVFAWERQAPEDGYGQTSHLQNTWMSATGGKPILSFKNPDREWEGYFFRVRTVEQDGRIVSANYGKIGGGIEIEPRDSTTCMIVFTYYFNPTSQDRNLEWDPKSNLFGSLKRDETPRAP